MNYVAAISIDFGSTNTGCAGIHSSENGGKIEYRTPEFFYHTGNYAKDNTWFFVKPDFLQKIKNDFKGVRDEDFSIESIVSHPDNPNIIWGRKPIKQFSSLIKTEGWIQFRWLKMDFLHGTSYSSDCLSIEQAIKLFFRILKIERLKAESARLKRKVSADEILWGVTIPSVLSTEQKQIMLSVVKDILSPDARILSEPEGPMVSSFVHGGKSFDGYQDGRVSLVIDCGGGTTDICLMQENTKGKKPIVDMIAHTEVSVAGGNDVDNAFYIYFLRKISKGKTSDNGICYDNLSDKELTKCLLDAFRTDEPKQFMDFEDDWLELKSSNDFEDESFPTCSFEIRPSYKKWLKNNGHTQICHVVDDLIEDGCDFEKKEFIATVFNPTFDIICAKVREIIQNNSAVKIDAIVPAGGMSCNDLLNTRLKRTISDLLGTEAIHKFEEIPDAERNAGNSIMDGALYMLLHRDFIRRLANKTYYYDSISEDTNWALKSMYKNCGVNLKIGEIENMRAEASQYKRQTSSDEGIILTPIAVQNQLVKNYTNNLRTRVDQVKVSVDFYSSQDKFVIYSNAENPDLTLEGSINVDCKPDCSYRLEVDFNQAQIAGDLHYAFIDSETGEIVAHGRIDNVLKD